MVCCRGVAVSSTCVPGDYSIIAGVRQTTASKIPHCAVGDFALKAFAVRGKGPELVVRLGVVDDKANQDAARQEGCGRQVTA